MYFTEIDEQAYGVKPMNCLSHMLIYKSRLRSYRTCPCATSSWAWCTATKNPACCTGFCACASSPRTTPTSSAARTSFRTRSSASSISSRTCWTSSASNSRPSSPPGPRNPSAPMMPGNWPPRPSPRPCRPSRCRLPSTKATALSTVPRLTSNSRMP